MERFLLSFELKGQELQIHGDEKGLANFCTIINKLLLNTKEGFFNHDHLMTPEYGGYELSEQNMGGEVIQQVKLYCWKGSEHQR